MVLSELLRVVDDLFLHKTGRIFVCSFREVNYFYYNNKFFKAHKKRKEKKRILNGYESNRDD